MAPHTAINRFTGREKKFFTPKNHTTKNKTRKPLSTCRDQLLRWSPSGCNLNHPIKVCVYKSTVSGEGRKREGEFEVKIKFCHFYFIGWLFFYWGFPKHGGTVNVFVSTLVGQPGDLNLNPLFRWPIFGIDMAETDIVLCFLSPGIISGHTQTPVFSLYPNGLTKSN